MSRSKWKGPFINFKDLKEIKVLKKQTLLKKPLLLSRDSEIVPSFSGSTFIVHSGKNYEEITITDQMIGHKIGEFSLTRAKFVFKKKKLKK